MQTELTLEEIAHAVAMRQLDADRLREVARDAARRAPVKIEDGPVYAALDKAVDYSALEDRVRLALQAELGDPTLSARLEVEAAINWALVRFADEAIAERGREIAELLGSENPGEDRSR